MVAWGKTISFYLTAGDCNFCEDMGLGYGFAENLDSESN